MSRHLRIRLLLLAVALTTAAVVWGATAVVRENAGREAQRTETAERMLTSMLQLEAGASTYLLSGNPDDEHLVAEGQAQLDAAATQARRQASGDPEATRAIETMRELELEWLGHAKAQIDRARRGRAVEPSVIEVRHLLVHAFREANATLRSEISAKETSARGRLTWGLVAISLLVTFLVAGVGLVLVRRRDREDEQRDDAENRHRDTQAEFAETMQLVQTEPRRMRSCAATSAARSPARAPSCCAATTARAASEATSRACRPRAGRAPGRRGAAQLRRHARQPRPRARTGSRAAAGVPSCAGRSPSRRCARR
jgi:CHASE3 domain sensor protein